MWEQELVTYALAVGLPRKKTLSVFELLEVVVPFAMIACYMLFLILTNEFSPTEGLIYIRDL